MYSLRRRPKSNDHDLIDDGTVIGQIIASDRGHTIYLLGDFEQLLPSAESADDALEAFEDWAASNTLSDVLTLGPTSEAPVEDPQLTAPSAPSHDAGDETRLSPSADPVPHVADT